MVEFEMLFVWMHVCSRNLGPESCGKPQCHQQVPFGDGLRPTHLPAIWWFGCVLGWDVHQGKSCSLYQPHLDVPDGRSAWNGVMSLWDGWNTLCQTKHVGISQRRFDYQIARKEPKIIDPRECCFTMNII